MKRIFLAIALALVVFSCVQRKKGASDSQPAPETVGESIDPVKEYYTHYHDSSDIDWDEVIPVFHCWRRDESRDSAQVAEWEALCERAFRPDSTERRYVQGYCRDMNQYVTVYDFVEVLFRADTSKRDDDDFVLWRLAQYDSLATAGSNTVERLSSLVACTDRLMDYAANTGWDYRFQESLRIFFDEFVAQKITESRIDKTMTFTSSGMAIMFLEDEDFRENGGKYVARINNLEKYSVSCIEDTVNINGQSMPYLHTIVVKGKVKGKPIGLKETYTPFDPEDGRYHKVSVYYPLPKK